MRRVIKSIRFTSEPFCIKGVVVKSDREEVSSQSATKEGTTVQQNQLDIMATLGNSPCITCDRAVCKELTCNGLRQWMKGKQNISIEWDTYSVFKVFSALLVRLALIGLLWYIIWKVLDKYC